MQPVHSKHNIKKTVHPCSPHQKHSFYNIGTHRRRIKTEEKAKVVTAVWGTELIQIYCRASYFAQGLFEQRDHFILFFISLWCISPYSLYQDHIFWRFIFQDERHHNGPISSKEQRSGMSNLGGGQGILPGFFYSNKQIFCSQFYSYSSQRAERADFSSNT